MTNCIPNSTTALPPRTTTPDDAPTPGPTVKNIGGGVIHVYVPSLDHHEFTTMWGLADVILAVAAIDSRERGSVGVL